MCGALAGAIIAVGLGCGRRKGEGDEAKERSYERVGRLVDSFRRRFGTALCRDLIDADLSRPEGREIYRRENIKEKFCVNYVKAAARAAYEAIFS
jgi:C_GCAxxG_C_C family probable redox protein